MPLFVLTWTAIGSYFRRVDGPRSYGPPGPVYLGINNIQFTRGTFLAYSVMAARKRSAGTGACKFKVVFLTSYTLDHTR